MHKNISENIIFTLPIALRRFQKNTSENCFQHGESPLISLLGSNEITEVLKIKNAHL